MVMRNQALAILFSVSVAGSWHYPGFLHHTFSIHQVLSGRSKCVSSINSQIFRLLITYWTMLFNRRTVDDFDDWANWLLYRGGVGVKADDSWETWWEEEHVRNSHQT